VVHEKYMKRDVGLITPSHRNDLERFAVLCDSIDRRVTGYQTHYVIVNDDDVPLFAPYSRPNRVILPASRLLPSWLKLLPLVSRKGRRIWWSFRSKPVHGWHIQQILKIAAVLQLPEQRFCIVDSDNVFVRPFDVGTYAGADRTPLYVDRAAISVDAPLHATWIRNCDRLLGADKATAFPADDYIGNGIVWDKLALRDMTRAIEGTVNNGWTQALCGARDFSEYLLYGYFVRNSPTHAATHRITTASLTNAYWEDIPLDLAAVTAMVESMRETQVALCIESFSRTPVSVIREAVGLQQHPLGAAPSVRPAERQLDAQLHHG